MSALFIMRNFFFAIFICSIFSLTAIAIEPPSTEILLRFFRDRLSSDSIWIADSRCIVISADDTTIAEGIDTLDISEQRCDFANKISPFAPELALIAFPLELARAEFDSIAVNKTRTRVDGLMCWKFRLFLGEETLFCYMSGDGFFRVMRMERTGRGKSKSDDVWEFIEVRKGKDLPCKVIRTVEFEWGGEVVNIVASRELSGFRVVGVDEP